MGHRRLWDATLWFWKRVELARCLLSLVIIFYLFRRVILLVITGLIISRLSTISWSYLLIPSLVRLDVVFVIIYAIFSTDWLFRRLASQFRSWIWISNLIHKPCSLDWALSHLSKKALIEVSRYLWCIWLQQHILVTRIIGLLVIPRDHWIDQARAVLLLYSVDLFGALIMAQMVVHFIYTVYHRTVHDVATVVVDDPWQRSS